MSDRGGGALATLGRLHRIVLAIERRRFRTAGGGGRLASRGGQLIPIFLLVKALSFRRKIDPDSLARAMAERLPDYIEDALAAAGAE